MRVEGPAVLPLVWGADQARFSLLHFTFGDERWAAAHTGDITSGEPVPLRIESACIFGHVFRSAQCDCGYQLENAMRQFCRDGRGLLVYGIDQDGRGLGIESHFAIYRMRQQEELDTAEVYERLRAPVDARSYGPVADILRYLDVRSVTLLSNNPRREEFLRENGFTVTSAPLEAPLDVHNMSTLMLEKEDLGYRWSFETHADWLEPLQAGVDGTDRSRAQLVLPGRGVPDGLVAQAEDRGNWALARELAEATPSSLPDGPLVVYLTDLPRVDEIDDYVRLGAAVLVVPFRHIPASLRGAAGDRLRIVDWARRNAYRFERPQWTMTHGSPDVHVYRRGDRVRVVAPGNGRIPDAVTGALAGAGRRSEDGRIDWIDYPASSHDAVLAALAAAGRPPQVVPDAGTAVEAGSC